MKKFLYYIFYGLWYLTSLLPFRVLYLISYFLYFIVYHVVRYRRKLVRKNLTDSFPEEDIRNIKKTERKFYAWFCDYIVETIKLASVKQSNLKKRIVFEGIEESIKALPEDKSCFVYLGHYCNWEWISSLPLNCGGYNVHFAQIYSPLKNKIMNDLFLKIRGRCGAESVAKQNVLRRILEWKQSGTRTITGFISDQVPKWNSIHYWTDFLNHDTPVFTGTERIARKMGFAVFYFDVKRVKRGYYSCRLVKITEDASLMPEFAITEKYMRMLEKTIREAPQYWLWSHNRWKRTRKEFNRMYPNPVERLDIDR
ncbi:MAG: acetyltransferase [Bacteroidales bacterium]|jgi:KDO2-lipid IV(A) lauroyltransferase|nr:acetyltransferase [Bacteroidales bacterium]